MRVLVGMECSGVVREAFAARGHLAMSCDLKPTEQEGAHYHGDLRDLFSGRVSMRRWIGADLPDLAILHPDCTFLTVAGLHRNKTTPGRAEKTEAALAFVSWLLNLPVKHKCLENPVGAISTRIRKPNQIIQPWQFGEPYSKATCLWLDGLPLLTHTHTLQPEAFQTNGRPRWRNQTASGQNNLTPSPTRAADRARTYEGIADAMADQWGEFIESTNSNRNGSMPITSSTHQPTTK